MDNDAVSALGNVAVRHIGNVRPCFAEVGALPDAENRTEIALGIGAAHTAGENQRSRRHISYLLWQLVNRWLPTRYECGMRDILDLRSGFIDTNKKYRKQYTKFCYFRILLFSLFYVILYLEFIGLFLLFGNKFYIIIYTSN